MADEVWLDVLPSMKGFGARLGREATRAARDAGGKAGREYSKAFNSGSDNTAKKKVQELEGAQKKASALVSKLSGDVSKSRQAMQKSAAEQLTAEQRLADAISKYGEDSTQAQAAALRLEAARGKAADSTQRFENAENALKEAQRASKTTTEQLEKAQGELNKQTGKAPGLWGKLKRGLGDTDKAANRTRKTLSRLWSGAKTLGKGLAIGGAAVGAFAATLTGMAIKGGIDRALNIEDARASLTGLGHDTKAVDKIMQSALASVKGTSYGLGDAATIAATAVAAGIEPGEKLTEKLKLTANSAALARVGLDEMGSILNKVWTSGKVGTEELNQLADRGIPIWTKLAESYGVSGDELRTMVSKGKVDAESFATVLTGTVGTAADQMGKTTRGMWANFKAALGRTGEVIAGPFLTAFRDGMGGAIPLVDKFTDAIKPFAEEFAKQLPGILSEIAGGFRAFIASFQAADGDITSSGFPGFMERLGYASAVVWDVLANKVVPALIATGEWVKNNKAWLAPLTVAVLSGAVAWKIYDMAMGGVGYMMGFLPKVIPAVRKGLLAVNAALRANPVGIFITILGALVGAFIYLWNTSDKFRGFFIGVWNSIKSVVSGVWNSIGPVFGAIVSGIRDGVGAAFTWLNDNVVQPVWSAIQTATEVGGAAIETALGAVGAAFGWLNDTIIQPAWSAITGAVSAAGQVIGSVLSSVAGFLKSTFGPVFKWLYDSIIAPVWGLIKWQIDLVSNILLFLFDLTVYTIRNYLAPAFTWFYQSVIKPVWAGIQTAISVAWAVIKTIFTAVITTVRTTLGAAFTWLRDGVIKPVWAGIKTAISVAWSAIKTVFTAVTTTIRTVLSAAFTWLRDSIITPVWNGIKLVIGLAWAGIKVYFQAIKAFIDNVLAPVFRWFRDSVIKPVWDGIKNTISNIWNNNIKPVFQALGDFIKERVAPAFEKGVEMIGKAWDNIKKLAGSPVYFVLETVYNKGIKATFDKVSEAIGSKARLPEAKTAGIPHFAKGGEMQHGWKLVGEEGPELIHTGPGYVYTAKETKKMLTGKTQAPTGAMDSLAAQGVHQNEAGIGGFWSSAWDGLKGAAQTVNSAISGAVKKGISWVRGGLSKAADFLLTPARNFVNNSIDGTNFFGSTIKSIATNALDGIVKWIKGEDEKAVDDTDGPAFIGARGGFARPSRGPITSHFGSPRGRYPHAGIDIAGGGPTYAAWNGRVQKTGWNIVGGRTGIGILVDHGNGLKTYYGHNPVGGVVVKPGQEVKAGQRLGAQGATGNVTGTHLHWETWNNGKPVNPLKYLKYDTGGILQPGKTLVTNETGRPERVLTEPQWKIAEQSLDQATSRKNGNEYHYHAGDGEGSAKDFFETAAFEERKLARTGGR